MPQITLEYTGNLDQPLDPPALLAEVHQVLAESGRVRLDNLKSRVVRLDHFRVGDGDTRHAFVHLEVRLLAGRTPAWKQAIGRDLLELLKAHFTPSLVQFDLQLAVEMQDIQRDNYFKYPAGTLTPV